MTNKTITKRFDAEMLRLLRGVCQEAAESAEIGRKCAIDDEGEYLFGERQERAEEWRDTLEEWKKELSDGTMQEESTVGSQEGETEKVQPVGESMSVSVGDAVASNEEKNQGEPKVFRGFNIGMLRVLREVCKVAWDSAEFGRKTAGEPIEEEEHAEIMRHAGEWYLKLGAWEGELANPRFRPECPVVNGEVERKKDDRADMFVRDADGMSLCNICGREYSPMVQMKIKDGRPDEDGTEGGDDVLICSGCLEAGLYKLVTVHQGVDALLSFMDVKILRGLISETNKRAEFLIGELTTLLCATADPTEAHKVELRIGEMEKHILEVSRWRKETERWSSQVDESKGERMLLAPIPIREKQSDEQG